MLAYQFNVVTLHTPIKIDGMETTVGRLIFNQSLGGLVPYVNDIMTKPKLSKLLSKIFEKSGMDATRDTIDRMKLLGFEMATVSGITWAMSDLMTPPEKTAIVKKATDEVDLINSQFAEGLLTPVERRSRIISVWEKAKDDLAKIVTGTSFQRQPDLSDRRFQVPRFMVPADHDDGYEGTRAEPERRYYRTAN